MFRGVMVLAMVAFVVEFAWRTRHRNREKALRHALELYRRAQAVLLCWPTEKLGGRGAENLGIFGENSMENPGSDGPEPLGKWGGRGAENLGIFGENSMENGGSDGPGAVEKLGGRGAENLGNIGENSMENGGSDGPGGVEKCRGLGAENRDATMAAMAEKGTETDLAEGQTVVRWFVGKQPQASVQTRFFGDQMRLLEAYGAATEDLAPFLARFGRVLRLPAATEVATFHRRLYRQLLRGESAPQMARKLGAELYRELWKSLVRRGLVDADEVPCALPAESAGGEDLQVSHEVEPPRLRWIPLDWGANGGAKNGRGFTGFLRAAWQSVRVFAGSFGRFALYWWGRIVMNAQTFWHRIPFSAMLGFSFLVPIGYNIADKYVMERARFGRYLANNIRLAYEDFYYSLKAAEKNNIKLSKEEIKEKAKKFLDVINERYKTNSNPLLEGLGTQNKIFITIFVFVLRCIALATNLFGEIPQYLPHPEKIQDIAFLIQEFIEGNAWRVYLKMPIKNMQRENYLKEILLNVQKDPIIAPVFFQGCPTTKHCNMDKILKN